MKFWCYPWNGFIKRCLTTEESAAQQVTGRSMERLRQKRPRLVLTPAEYNKLKNRILERDGWTCQCCGSSINLQVHHLVTRSQLGLDVLDNLMTLCVACHRRQHNIRGVS
jgi:5-methylcytosine-specific restriction endonuclease McrA